jgi:hypothetical protein
MTPRIGKVHRFIDQLYSLNRGKEAVEGLVRCGPAAIMPLRIFLLEGRPRKIFQPRLWAVEALARLGAKGVLVEYLLQKKEIPDPEDRFGEEAVESAAARFLSSWRSQNIYQVLFKLSERRMLLGLIDALAEFKRSESIPYFERALEDDFYRPAAENAFLKLGTISCGALSLSAMTSTARSSMEESSSSLERRRSAVRVLNRIGISAEHWEILKNLISESDQELVVGGAKLGIEFATKVERALIAHRLIELLSSVPWYLQEDLENLLVTVQDEAAADIEEEIAERMGQPEEVRTLDARLRALLRVKRRFERIGNDCFSMPSKDVSK